MNSELKISIYIDEKTKIASLTVDGINIYGEACNFIFTDSKIARALYNRIVMSIYSAGNSAVSDVYEIKKTLNECGEAIKSGIEDSIKSVDIRNGKFVSELEKLYSLKEGYIDDISNPSHYTQGRQYEPRKVIQDWGLDWNLGNAVKYISRAGRKDDPVKDLKKARQYLDWAIEERIIKTEERINE